MSEEIKIAPKRTIQDIASNPIPGDAVNGTTHARFRYRKVSAIVNGYVVWTVPNTSLYARMTLDSWRRWAMGGTVAKRGKIEE